MKHLHFVQSIEPLEGGGLGKAALELSAAMHGPADQSSLVTTCAGQNETGNGWQAYRRCDLRAGLSAGPRRRALHGGAVRDDQSRDRSPLFRARSTCEARSMIAKARKNFGRRSLVARNWRTLAGAALVVRVCDELRVVLLFRQAGVRADGSGEVGGRRVVDEAR